MAISKEEIQKHLNELKFSPFDEYELDLISAKERTIDKRLTAKFKDSDDLVLFNQFDFRFVGIHPTRDAALLSNLIDRYKTAGWIVKLDNGYFSFSLKK